MPSSGDERASGEPDGGPFHRVTEWLLLDGDRRVITMGLSVSVFLLLYALHTAAIISFANENSMTRIAGGMIAGTFSLVTLVVSINQLILSREFQSAGEIRDQLDEVMRFRRDIEDATGTATTPGEPTGLLAILVRDVQEHVTGFEESVAGHANEEVRRFGESFAAVVDHSTDDLLATLEATEFEAVHALSAAIDYPDSWQLHAALQFKQDHGSSLSEQSHERLDELSQSLQLFTIAREQLKTTYLQRELTRFSRLTILTGLPAVTAAVVLALVYAGPNGAMLSARSMELVSMSLITIVSVPLTLLGAFILRSATIARRSASIGPILHEADPNGQVLDRREDHPSE